MTIYVNKVQLVGNLGADPEERGSNGKGPVIIRLATTEKWKDRDGNKQERTQWHSVTVWPDHTKKFLLDYAKKGDVVYVEGQLEYSQYEKDGQTIYKTEIVVKPFSGNVQLQSRNGGGSSRSSDYDSGGYEGYGGYDPGEKPSQGPGRPSRPGQSRPAFEVGIDDDIPF